MFDATTILQVEKYVAQEEKKGEEKGKEREREKWSWKKGGKRAGGLSLCELA